MEFNSIDPKTKIDQSGRAYIPKGIRKNLNIGTGQPMKVLVNQEEKAILFKIIEGGDNNEN
ncbi:hypothetical protein JCM16358_11600 [Halanaerocella petrolearia]